MNRPSAAVLDRFLAWPLLCTLVFTIPWEKSLMVPGVGTITRLVGLLAAASVLALYLTGRKPRAPNLVLVLLAAFVAWTSLTWLWSYNRPATAAKALTFFQLLILVWLVWELTVGARRQSALLAAYVAGAAVASVLTLSRFIRGLETYYRRYAAAGFEPNDLGLTVALSLPLAFYLALRLRNPHRWLCYAGCALAIAAVLLSASRTALIVSLIAFAFPAWSWRASDRTQELASLALLALLVLGALYLAPQPSRQRLSTLPQEIRQGTLHNRTQIWRAGLKVFRHRPIRGVGAGAYPEAVRPILGTPGRPGHQYVAHNTYLSVLVECGLIGFGLFSLAGLALAVYVWMLPSLERALWTVMLAVCGTGILTLTWEHRKPVWLMAALILTEWARSFAPNRAKP